MFRVGKEKHGRKTCRHSLKEDREKHAAILAYISTCGEAFACRGERVRVRYSLQVTSCSIFKNTQQLTCLICRRRPSPKTISDVIGSYEMGVVGAVSAMCMCTMYWNVTKVPLWDHCVYITHKNSGMRVLLPTTYE